MQRCQGGFSIDGQNGNAQHADHTVFTEPTTHLPSPLLPSYPSSASSSTSALELSLPSHKSIYPRMRPTKINILPRAGGSYSPLENGGGRGGGRRFGWKSMALVAGLFVGALWMVGPRDTYDKFTNGGQGVGYDDDLENIAIPKNQPHPPFVPTKGHSSDEDATSGDSQPRPLLTLPTSPHSPETDPDRLKTVHCISPHDPSKPLVQYALMLDAGSTGSRIHVYKFHNCLASPTLEYEVFKNVMPGLSSYAGSPLKAAESLDELMDEAVRVVPAKLQGCTKVAVKATAGLRLLGHDASEEILTAVKERLKSKYKFTLAGDDPVAIMDGKDEGVYAWITANYLLGTIGGSTSSASTRKADTYAVLDLGGASTQIVFEPSFSTSSGKGGPSTALEDGDHKYVLSFGGKTYTLYQHSYLGYGLMRARRSVHNLVAFMWDFRLEGHGVISTKGPGAIGEAPTEDEQVEHLVVNPCLSQGTRRLVNVDGGKWSGGLNITMVGEDVGSFEACNRVVELVMAKDSLCKVKPCSFNGVYQPSILDTFPSGGILSLSYFYDRISPLLPALSSSTSSKRAWSWDAFTSSSSTTPLITSSSLPISEIAHMAQKVCAGSHSWELNWGPTSDFAKSFLHSSETTPAKASETAISELKDRPEYCLDLTFMHALLRLGYEFGSERSVRVEKKVDGVELGWCLGATIATLLDDNDELTCVA